MPTPLNQRHELSPTNHSQQNQWLKHNYPNRAAYFDQLPTKHAYFRDDVLAGQIQLGMTIEEVLIATGTEPYGPKSFKGKFWCGNLETPRCSVDCAACDGLVFLGNQLLFFSGRSQPPTVTDIDEQSRPASIFNSASHSLRYKIAEALYKNEIVKGMSLDQVHHVISTEKTEPRYYCNNHPLQSPTICSLSCKTCRIETDPARTPRQTGRIIYLESRGGELRVVGINQ